ncbi:MAG: DegT/DnrJ/EryC1/StrS family aminotransferase [Patescibacteria group bacterium]|nr:DegT/DnrJ/EryC1/StrS family aminotransferase [Patescibacteria group bacterium]MDE2172639.1 DegT/DnrJ/EryC1/StrS family aminotransferase [Patescibacteria group bacterium]
MKISFNNFSKLYGTEKIAIDRAIKKVLSSGRYILGDEVADFEKDFAAYIGVSQCVGVANGLEALQIALMAAGIGPGDEVITTAHSAAATALSIRAVGAKPVFIDIDDYYHLDAAKIESAITSKTRAIIPVHLYGQACDMNTIMDVAKKHNLVVIEDCAQAHGALWNGRKVGSFGTAGCFSFYPTKNLGAVGDAGAIVTHDSAFAEKCRMMRNYGQRNRYEHDVYGINSRLDEIQAAVLRVLLKKLDRNNKRRLTIAMQYLKGLKDIGDIQLPRLRMQADHVFHLFVIETGRRDDLMAHLKEAGIDSLIHYPIPIHKQRSLAEFNSLSLPVLELKVTRILSLPVHPYLTTTEVKKVIAAIKKFYESPLNP